ncbi:MAG: hypothetical protein JWM80_6397 [Cyanobacteria bacterium RYN_339]|nr:hypothetical protein [Cyanobacteria bacterium RYN_339]
MATPPPAKRRRRRKRPAEPPKPTLGARLRGLGWSLTKDALFLGTIVAVLGGLAWQTEFGRARLLAGWDWATAHLTAQAPLLQGRGATPAPQQPAEEQPAQEQPVRDQPKGNGPEALPDPDGYPALPVAGCKATITRGHAGRPLNPLTPKPGEYEIHYTLHLTVDGGADQAQAVAAAAAVVPKLQAVLVDQAGVVVEPWEPIKLTTAGPGQWDVAAHFVLHDPQVADVLKLTSPQSDPQRVDTTPTETAEFAIWSH